MRMFQARGGGHFVAMTTTLCVGQVNLTFLKNLINQFTFGEFFLLSSVRMFPVLPWQQVRNNKC